MRYSIALACAMFGMPLAAHDLKVVTDFPVTHALVSMVLGEQGQADLLLDRGGDPHSFQLRPTQARALAEADLIFWVGDELTPWLTRALSGIEAQGEVVTLISADGLHLQDFAHGHRHDDHGHAEEDHGHAHDDHSHAEDDHGHGHDDHGHAEDDHGHAHDDHGHSEEDHGHGHDDHGHAEDVHGHAHDDHGHAEEDHGHGHDDHGHAEEDHGHGHDDHSHAEDVHGHGHDDHGHSHDHDHSHDGLDPHAWMNTGNVTIWLDLIAEELAEHDPDHADVFRANAAAAKEVIASLTGELEAILEPVSAAPLVMFHDAYGYMADQFGLNIAGTISLGDAVAPGAQRLTELRADLAEDGAVCIFPEVNHSSRYIDVVVEGTGVRVGRELDPAGVMLEPGADLYPTLMRNLAQAIAECVTG